MLWLRLLRSYWWSVPALGAALVGLCWGTKAFEAGSLISSPNAPSIQYPALIDLGDRKANEVVTSRFEVINRGGQDLVIKAIRASCSCAFLQRDVGGRLERIDQLSVPAGERADLLVRTTVRVDRAGTFYQMLAFDTNDPAHPEAQIRLIFRTASGGLRVYPNAVHFGQIPVGREVRQVLEVRDHDQLPQIVARVVSSDPTRVAVRWTGAGQSAERSEKDRLLGRVELVPNTAHPLLLNSSITIEFADPTIEPATIEVSGRVTPRFEVMPASLVLPLSAGGAPIYAAKCLVRGPDDRPWRLEIESASPGLTVELLAGSDGAIRMVRIAWARDPGAGRRASNKLVRLRVQAGEDSEILDIPVTCEQER